MQVFYLYYGRTQQTRMWANAQRDGRSAERRKLWLTPILECRAVTLPRRESVEISWVPQTNEMISAASGPKFTIL